MTAPGGGRSAVADPPATSRQGGPDARRSGVLALLGLGGIALALALRVQVAGVEGARSVPAGLAFGAALVVVALAVGLDRPGWGVRTWVWGLAAAAVLCTVPLGHRIGSGLTGGALAGSSGQFAAWACVVTFVAVAEEAVLRGAVFEAVTRWRGDMTAIAVTAAAFGLLHVPVYGWAVLPLDLAVGVALGVLRVVAGSVTAPVVAHVVADLAGWFLR